MASPMPVLPEVPSTMVDPGPSSPARSAASIIAAAGRSLTLPPGLRISSFATRGQGRSRPRRSRRTIGVLPTRSRRESATSIFGPRSVSGTTSTPARSGRPVRSSSVCSSVGSPALRSCTATAAASWPTTPTRRGILPRMSAITAGGTSPEGTVRTWCARAARRSGGGSVPTTTSRSMATCWPSYALFA